MFYSGLYAYIIILFSSIISYWILLDIEIYFVYFAESTTILIKNLKFENFKNQTILFYNISIQSTVIVKIFKSMTEAYNFQLLIGWEK